MKKPVKGRAGFKGGDAGDTLTVCNRKISEWQLLFCSQRLEEGVRWGEGFITERTRQSEKKKGFTSHTLAISESVKCDNTRIMKNENKTTGLFRNSSHHYARIKLRQGSKSLRGSDYFVNWIAWDDFIQIISLLNRPCLRSIFSKPINRHVFVSPLHHFACVQSPPVQSQQIRDMMPVEDTWLPALGTMIGSSARRE